MGIIVLLVQLHGTIPSRKLRLYSSSRGFPWIYCSKRSTPGDGTLPRERARISSSLSALHRHHFAATAKKLDWPNGQEHRKQVHLTQEMYGKAGWNMLFWRGIDELLGIGAGSMMMGSTGCLIYSLTNEMLHRSYTYLLVDTIRDPLPWLTVDTFLQCD